MKEQVVKIYQVFISATYKDLELERLDALNAVLKLGHMPVGMEIFPAVNRDQFEYIKAIIDKCDYYILIVAGSYGSLAPDGVSYTEKEFDYAIERGKEVLVFTHTKIEELPSRFTETKPSRQNKLKAFREKIDNGRVRVGWTTRAELQTSITASLGRAMLERPQAGYIRADKIADTDGASQLAELKHRISQISAERDEAITACETLKASMSQNSTIERVDKDQANEKSGNALNLANAADNSLETYGNAPPSKVDIISGNTYTEKDEPKEDEYTYKYTWQGELFIGLDSAMLSIDVLGLFNNDRKLEGVAHLVENMVFFTWRNLGLRRNREYFTSTEALNAIKINLKANNKLDEFFSDKIFNQFSQYVIRSNYNSSLNAYERAKYLEYGKSLIKHLKGVWKRTAKVIHSDFPLFSNVSGSPYKRTGYSGVILEIFEGDGSEIQICPTKVEGLKPGMFVTYELGDRVDFKAYYQKKPGTNPLVAFEKGREFIGCPVEFILPE